MTNKDAGEKYISVLNRLSGKNMLTALKVSLSKPFLALFIFTPKDYHMLVQYHSSSHHNLHHYESFHGVLFAF
jgi:hypothetical protein